MSERLGMRRYAWAGGVLSGMLLASACSSELDSGNSAQLSAADGPASAGVAQGGAQDFGAFREALDDERVPTAELLDDVGFFNEHKIELPEANCGEPVCLHAQLGVMGNMIDGANCTMLFIGMNTLLDENAPRRPLNLALALDVSGSMAGPALDNLIIGLEMMLPSLQPEDRVSLITFSDNARVVVSGAEANTEAEPAAEWADVSEVIQLLQAGGSTNIYAGLSEAYLELDKHAQPGYENRVVLLSDGEATVGFSDHTRFYSLASEYAAAGYSLSTIGIGDSYDSELLRRLSVEGAGAYYFLDEPVALREVFTEEVQTSLVPLAKNAKIVIDVGEHYRARTALGTNQAQVSRNRVEIDMPVLQIAQRRSVDDNELGRRGGGGVIIVELTPKDADVDPDAAEHSVGTVTLSYEQQGESDSHWESEQDIRSPLAPGQTPSGGYFEGESVEKSFVMLNLYAGMHVALEQVRIGDPEAALSALSSLETAVVDWVDENPDPDIDSDVETLRELMDAISTQVPVVRTETIAPPPPWGWD